MKQFFTLVILLIANIFNCTSSQPCTCTIDVNASINNVSCNGSCDGTIDLSISGCQSPYTFSWNDGPTAGDRSGLCPGAYSVTVTDINGCMTSLVYNITQIQAPNVNINVFPSVICQGDCVFISASSPGDPGILYYWSNTTTGPSIFDCPHSSTSYTVVATDIITGCTTTESAFVTVIPDPVISITDTGCCLYAGTGFFSYLWSTNETTDHICPGISGTYYLTVTDQINGCTGTASYNLNCPCTILSDNYSDSTPWIQVGTTVTVSGGRVNFNSIPGYSDERVYRDLGTTLGYHWKSEFEFYTDTNNNEGANLGVSVILFCLSNNHLTPYRVWPESYPAWNYSDQNFISITLGTPHSPGPHYQDSTIINVICKTGSPPAGSGLPVSALLKLPAWNQVYYTRLERTNVSIGVISIFSDAARTVHIAGSPVCFTIPPGLTGLNTLQHSNLDQADAARRFTGWVDNTLIDTCYEATVCDPCSLLNINFSDNCDSTVCINITGGCAPFSYQWSTIPVSSMPCVNNIPPCSSYTVTVTDMQGITHIITRQKAELTATVTKADCPLHDGAIDLTVSCINTNCYPLNFLWSDGESTEDISGLPQGNYCVTITDNCGNSYVCCFDVPCNTCCNNCSVPGPELIVNGDFENYNYGFFSEYIYDPLPIANLSEGQYTITSNPQTANVSFNPCSDHTPYGTKMLVANGNAGLSQLTVWKQSVSITPNTDYDFSFWTTNVNSYSSILALLQVYFTSSAANSPVGNLLTSAVYEPNSDPCNWKIIKICWNSGTYSGPMFISIKDINPDSIGNDFAIDDISFKACVPKINLKYHINCNSICIDAMGGCTSNYTYLWSTGETSPCISYLSCISYTVTVTDVCGCSASMVITAPHFWFTDIKSHCNSSDGMVCINIDTCQVNSGFIPPYLYQWSPVSSTLSCLVNVSHGTYCVTVTDASGNTYICCHELKCICPWNGCILRLTNNLGLDYYQAKTYPISTSNCPYTFSWSDNSQNPHHTLYDFTSTTINYTPPIPAIGQPQLQYPLHLMVTSCCGDSVNLTYNPFIINLIGIDPCCSVNSGSLAISSVTGGSDCIPAGTYVYQWQKENGTVWSNISSSNNLTGGTYRLKVTDCCGNIAYKNITLNSLIQQFSVIKLTHTNVTDCQAYNGTIGFTVNGICAPGTISYTYIPFPSCVSCSPATYTHTQSSVVNGPELYQNLAPGAYLFTVSKCAGGANNSLTFTVVIHFPQPTLKFKITNCNLTACMVTNVCCNPAFSILYNNVWYESYQCRNIGNMSDDLHPGDTYSFMVTDCEGQTTTHSITIPWVGQSSTDASCGLNNGSICMTLGYWNGSLTYSWDGGYIYSTNSNHICLQNASAGNHCLKVTNSSGDTWECCVTLGNTPAVTFNVQASGCRQKCVNVLTGTSPYVVTWSPCGTTTTVYNGNCYDQCGCYNVRVQDAAGCSASQQVIINGVNISQNGNCRLCADMCNGFMTYSYLWSNGAVTRCINCLESGTYSVTVTDQNNVKYICSKTITVAPFQCQITAYSPQILVKVSGGCLNYTCNWQFNSLTQIPKTGTTDPFIFSFPNPPTNDSYHMVFSDNCGHYCSPFQFNAKSAQDSVINTDDPVLAPNPNSGVFHLLLSADWFDKDVECTVFDMTGKVISREQLNNKHTNSVQFDLSDKPKGIYCIRLMSNDRVWNQKVILE
ncbi:MAG: T9SS type A sorting domain-containing protein [Bacteroidia bacterium]|nr:T9SS type A sorting domain-containing protein [Bacteroidia bacterium]